jgi:hypothetical protein
VIYRFIHAADIHLDSPLLSLALRDPGLSDLIGNATRRAFMSGWGAFRAVGAAQVSRHALDHLRALPTLVPFNCRRAGSASGMEAARPKPLAGSVHDSPTPPSAGTPGQRLPTIKGI